MQSVEPSYVKIRCKLCLESNQRNNTKKKKCTKLEPETVYFTHMGRRPHRTDLDQIVQFSPSHRLNQSFKIWYSLVSYFRLWRGALSYPIRTQLVLTICIRAGLASDVQLCRFGSLNAITISRDISAY